MQVLPFSQTAPVGLDHRAWRHLFKGMASFDPVQCSSTSRVCWNPSKKTAKRNDVYYQQSNICALPAWQTFIYIISLLFRSRHPTCTILRLLKKVRRLLVGSKSAFIEGWVVPVCTEAWSHTPGTLVWKPAETCWTLRQLAAPTATNVWNLKNRELLFDSSLHIRILDLLTWKTQVTERSERNKEKEEVRLQLVECDSVREGKEEGSSSACKSN